jgi:hypothetical protein
MSGVGASGLGAVHEAESPALAASGSEARPGNDTVGDQPAVRKIVRGVCAHLLAYNLLRTVMAVAAAGVGIEPRRVSFKGAKQAVTSFAPKIEAARPGERPALIDALLAVIAYHRVGDRPGRWEPRALKRRPKPRARLGQPRADARLPENRSRWF